jgi:hypothetical protein
MRTLLCGAAAIVSNLRLGVLGLGVLALVATFVGFRYRGPGCFALFPDRHSRELCFHREFPAVMTSVPLNAGINERYLSGRTLE